MTVVRTGLVVSRRKHNPLTIKSAMSGARDSDSHPLSILRSQFLDLIIKLLNG